MTIQLIKDFVDGKPQETTITIPDCAQLITYCTEVLKTYCYQECYGCCPNEPELYKQFDSETFKSCIYLNDVILFRVNGFAHELIPTKDFAGFQTPVYMKLIDNEDMIGYSCTHYYKMTGIDTLGIEVCELKDELTNFKPFFCIKQDVIPFDFLFEYKGQADYITEEDFNKALTNIKEKMKI